MLYYFAICLWGSQQLAFELGEEHSVYLLGRYLTHRRKRGAEECHYIPLRFGDNDLGSNYKALKIFTSLQTLRRYLLVMFSEKTTIAPTLFRYKRFILDEMTKQNASKAIFIEVFSSFLCYFIFPLIYVNIATRKWFSRKKLYEMIKNTGDFIFKIYGKFWGIAKQFHEALTCYFWRMH